MKKFFLINIIFMSMINGFSQSNDPRIENIFNKVSEILKSDAYVTEQQAKPGGGVCFMYIDVRKKDTEIRRIHAYTGESEPLFDKQFYFWEGKVFFIYIKKSIASTDPETGKKSYKIYEYRHFFENGDWFKTIYTQYLINDGKKQQVQKIDLYDPSRAMSDLKEAENFLTHAQKNNWYGICGK